MVSKKKMESKKYSRKALKNEGKQHHKEKMRAFQSEAVKFAIKYNTIIYLETGSGKTLIAVEIIKHFLEECPSEGENSNHKICIFLAPTNNIVQQQYEVLKGSLNLNCALFFDNNNLEDKSKEEIDEKFRNSYVIVMTPQCFLNLLRMSLEMKNISLIVFDECHHVRKDDVV